MRRYVLIDVAVLPQSCSRHEMMGCVHGIAFSTWAPVSAESVDFGRQQISHGHFVRTFFASPKSRARWIRSALITTCTPPCSPRQMSVSPLESSARLPRFSSPAESTAEVGSRSITLHTLPEADANFAFRESTVGYASGGTSEDFEREKRAITRHNIPDRLSLKTSSDPLVSVPERFAVAPRY